MSVNALVLQHLLHTATQLFPQDRGMVIVLLGLRLQLGDISIALFGFHSALRGVLDGLVEVCLVLDNFVLALGPRILCFFKCLFLKMEKKKKKKKIKETKIGMK